ncbi:MAG: YfhO family protein [Candidatus Hydrogenedentes bacterium]|nr:YfhO family protein [Candidatus Hydrogenedentota bacterium]
MRACFSQHPRLREALLALAALIIIAGALALTFLHVLRSGPEDIAGRYDIFRYYGPITFYLDFCLSQGELPLWNPMVYCGLPNAANPQAFVFYPLNLLRSLLLPSVSPLATNISLVIFVGLHLLAMGWGTWLLARAHRLSFPAALVAALAWVCSALIVRRACEYHFLYTMAWLPFLLILVKAAIDAREARLKFAIALAAGLLFGMAILGGFLQIVNYLGVTIAFYALLYRASLAGEGRGWRAALARVGVESVCFATMLAVAGLIALVLLLPVTELAPFSTRDKGSSVSMYSDLMAWDIKRLYQSLVIYAGPQWETETARLAGVTAILLAVAGCFHRRRGLVALFGLLAYALIDCGFGPPFPIASLVNLVTPFSSSAYSRGFDFALLPLGMLAGLGVDTLRDAATRPAARRFLAVALLYAAGVTLIPLWGWTHPHGYLPVSGLVVLIPALGLLLMLAAIALRGRAAGAIAFLLPFVLLAETLAWNSVFVPWMIARHLNETPPLQAGHQFPQANRRGTDPIPNRTLYSMRPAINGVDPLHLADMRVLVSGQFREKLNKREVRDWEPTAENARGNLFLKRFFWLVPAWDDAPLPGKTDLFPPTSVVYLDEAPALDVPRHSGPGGTWASVSERAIRVEIPGAAAQVNDPATPLRSRFLFTVPETIEGVSAGSSGALHSALVLHYVGDTPAQVDTVFVDREDGARTWGLRHRPGRGAGVLEVPVPDMRAGTAEVTIKPEKQGNFRLTDAYLAVDPEDRDQNIAIRDFSANRMALSVEVAGERPSMLVFLDAWYPGWTAWINGEPARIQRANGAFKAIALPPGTHEVVFAFRPRSVYIGLAISLLAAVGAFGAMAVLLIRYRRDQHRRPSPAPLLEAPDSAQP